jgi:anaerobic magnesium-protoporphyrin IX monomethyl ester cyclase
MKTLLLNLPHPKRVMRRWVASYYAPNFLMPPLELMGLGAIVREWKQGEVRLIDAIAEGLDVEGTVARVRADPPDLIVSLAGFNTFPRDMAALDRIAESLPEAKVVLLGHLPSLFAPKVLEKTRADVVVRGEPELTFSELYEALRDGRDLGGVAGLSYRENGSVRTTRERGRIEDLDRLPFPDHSLLHLELYNESYLKRPIGVIMSERGCPFGCSYCVRTFGRRLLSRSAESILSEIEALGIRHGIRNIRFMDDTFTANRARLIALCQGLIERRLGVAWTCLTRVDVLDAEALSLMRRAGCRRMYLGLESGSQRVLDSLHKGLTVEGIRERMKTVRKSGIEASAFFIVGAPGETDEDVEESIRLAIELDLDYVIVTKMQYWPGTDLFESHGSTVGFDLFSGEELLYAPAALHKARVWQRRFYRRFYLRPAYVARHLGTLWRSPRDVAQGFFKLCTFLLKRNGWDDFI